LPAVLSDAGYATAGISTNLWVSSYSGFDLGFDEFCDLTVERNTHMTSTSPRQRAAWAWQALRARVDDGAAAVERLIDQWLSQRAREPFFWFVNLVECHSPYLPPKPYNNLSALDRLRAADEARRYLNLGAIWKGSCGGFDIPPDTLVRMRELYTASIRLMDDWLARLLASLDRHRLLDETIVIVTSDHGENLGEGQLIGHAFSLDDRLVRVPFVVSGPAKPLPAPRASLVDVPAWLAASIGLGDHPWGELSDSRDVAVAQFDAPAPAEHPRAQWAIREWGLGEEALRRLTTSFSCATNGRRKLLRRLGHEELIDLDTDPFETDAALVGPDAERRWAAELPALRVALDEAEAMEIPGIALNEPVAASDEEVTDLEARMKLLGYL
jgi:arylsulfatase A-like enzyme